LGLPQDAIQPDRPESLHEFGFVRVISVSATPIAPAAACEDEVGSISPLPPLVINDLDIRMQDLHIRSLFLH
jgi:hypothetical protein